MDRTTAPNNSFCALFWEMWHGRTARTAFYAEAVGGSRCSLATIWESFAPVEELGSNPPRLGLGPG